MLYKKVKFFLFLFLLLFLILGAGFSYALEVKYPVLPGGPPPPTNNSTLPDYVNYLFYLGLFTGIVLASGLLVYGGVLYIVSLNNPDRIVSAREWIKSAFFGLLILFTSVLVLKTINPQLIIIESPKLEPTIIEERPDIPPPPSKDLKTLINAEIPFGQIIEKRIFEEIAQEQQKSRMDRIKDIANNSLKIAEKLKTNSQELKKLTEKCSCYVTSPVNSSCSCDPCLDVRQEIQEIEKENLKLMGIEIKETDSYGKPIIIPPYNPNLILEQEKANKEIRLLNEELSKIERAEIFMQECPLWILESLAEFLSNKDWYRANNWHLVKVKFFKDISIGNDDATFYCPVSGTFTDMGELPEIPIEDIMKSTSEPPAEPTGTLEKMYCEEVPVGKIIDRTKRLGNKLVERMEKLNNLNQQMVNAVDQLHILISQCSSQRCTNNLGICVGEPCLRLEIENQVQKIIGIFEGIPQEINQINPKEKEGIKDVAMSPISEILKSNLSKQKTEQVGIVPIIENIVPGLIDDLNIEVRKKMERCVTDIPLETLEAEPETPIVFLINCESALRSLGEEKTIQKCLLEEKDFQDCLSQCYLEKNQNIYKECLENCLVKKTGKKIEEVKSWKHQVDFFCCG